MIQPGLSFLLPKYIVAYVLLKDMYRCRCCVGVQVIVRSLAYLLVVNISCPMPQKWPPNKVCCSVVSPSDLLADLLKEEVLNVVVSFQIQHTV